MAERKLLLADDSITIQKVVNLTFADEGIDVVSVGDGDSAVQRVAEEMPDVVLADVNMPGKSGYQVCEFIKGDDRTRHIPVLLLVGAFEQFDDAEAARVGASGHLTKPFQSIRQLVNQVADLIEASRQTWLDTEQPGPPPVPQEAEVAEPATITQEFDAAEHAPLANPFDEPVTSQFETFREDRIASMDQERPPAREPSAETPAASELQPEPARSEPEDIDSLYRRSIGEDAVTADQDFPDVGVDDEMIETSYSAPQPDTDVLELVEPKHSDLDVAEAASSAEPPVPMDTETLSPYETTNLSAAEDLPYAPNPDQTVRLDPAMVEAKMAEANRRFEPAEDPTSHHGSEPRIGEETIRMDARFDQPSATYEFDDVDLLDIPAETEIEITAPADAAGKGSNKQVVTLSPELIEMIAQRVVEKLSEKY